MNTKKENLIQTDKCVTYEVTYGAKNEKERNTRKFSDEKMAIAFFEKKDKEGFHVDAYETETIIKRKKLTN
jgi:hypothetical protein